MEISSDVYLRGENWKKAKDGLSFFFDTSMQPNYSLYIISVAIGIMYDKQLETAGFVDKTAEENLSVPRTVLHNHGSDLDFLFQTAILTSKNTDFEKKDKMDLAFNASSEIDFKKLEFLTKFANYGVGVLLDQITDNPIETMENIKDFINNTFKGINYGVYGVSDIDLDVNDLI